jgi:histidinol-phosphate aminotransferase
VTQGYQHPVTAPGALRLHLNENTAGCSPRVLDAIRGLSREDLALYPDYERINAATAAHLGVPVSSVLLTNGLDEGIFLAAVLGQKRRPADGPPESIVVLPAFDMYAITVDACGGAVVTVAPKSDYTFPLEATLAAISTRTRTVFITSPNNPTGVRVANDAIRQVARALPPEALVFVDEAYYDFSGDTIVPELGGLPNVVVGRTFAKAQGLAALRAGALVAASETLDLFRPLIPPYSLNVAAAAALEAALADRDYVGWYVAQVAESRERFYAFCRRHGFECWESAANFVLARVGTHATGLTAALREKGIYIRDKSADPNCAGCIRVTTGIVEATDAAIAAMEEYLCAAE